MNDDFLSLIGHFIHASNWLKSQLFFFFVVFLPLFLFWIHVTTSSRGSDLTCHNNSVGSLASYPSVAIVTARSQKPQVISLAPVVFLPWNGRPAAHLHVFSPVCRSPTAAPQVFVWLSVAFHYRFIAWVSGVMHVVSTPPSLTLTCLCSHRVTTYRYTLMHVT